MSDFVDSSSLINDAESLRHRLQQDGYLFLRGLLPAQAVLDVRRDVVTALDRCGWIQPGSDPLEGRPSDRATPESAGAQPEFFRAYEALQRLQSFHELAHQTPVTSVAEQLLGDEVLVHPRKIARPTLPGHQAVMTPPHQDYRLIQGTADVLTVWIPLGDCPDEVGGLTVKAGSHRDGLLQVQAAEGVGGVRVDVDIDPSDERWVAGEFRAGDALLFTSLTVHGARPNVSGRMRLSVDYRYQAINEPVVQASLDPHYSPPLPAYSELTRGWTSTDAVQTPDGLRIVGMADPFDPALAVPPSRFTGVAA